MPGMKEHIIQKILNYIYKGEASVPKDEVSEFMACAEALGLKQLLNLYYKEEQNADDKASSGDNPVHLSMELAVKEELDDEGIDSSSQQTNETDDDKPIFYCEECKKHYTSRKILMHHKKVIYILKIMSR